jgi:hypothetical protein
MITSFPSSAWDRVEKNDGSQTIVRWGSVSPGTLFSRSRSNRRMPLGIERKIQMISFQSSRERNDSSGNVRTLVNNTSHERRLPRHRKP